MMDKYYAFPAKELCMHDEIYGCMVACREYLLH